MKWLRIGIGVIIVKFAVYLLLIAIVPGISVAPQPLRRGKPATPGPDAEPPAARTDVQFLIDGVALSAWLYLPALRGDKYRPVTYAGRVRCPVLLQVCDQDALTPPAAAAATVKKLGANATVIRYPIGHFDIYFGDNLERSVGDQLAFLRQHLG